MSKIIQLYTDVKKEISPETRGKFVHLMYCPFTGLGLYGGFRGNHWLKNRIKIFKQFVLPSLLAQTSQNFTLWISWRPEERFNPIVSDFVKFLNKTTLKTVHTYAGLCFYDDKYPPEIARERLISAIHSSSGNLINATEGVEYVLMTIQPSDDCYHKEAVKEIQDAFKDPKLEAVGFKSGYIINHQTLEVAEWNPETNPPFYTIKFLRPVFVHPLKHLEYTGLAHDIGGYKRGTPLPSHEYVKDCFTYGLFDVRGFLVGTHGENISTIWKHPYKGNVLNKTILDNFGLSNVSPLTLPVSFRRMIFSKLPHKVQRKLRYWAGEKKWILRPIFSIIYNGLR